MSWSFKQLLALFSKPANSRLFLQSNHGLEREGLRIDHKAHLSQNPHPEKLGSALTNPNITTDFTEAQLELVTPVFNSEKGALNYLKNIHTFVDENLENGEYIWPFSMPCLLPGESHIPFAQYGKSHTGQTRTNYRLGLSARYGRKMQTISGIHYNFSFSDKFWDLFYQNRAAKVLPSGQLDPAKRDKTQLPRFTKFLDPKTRFISESYLHLIRNFLRLGWIYTYLYGSAPVIDKSYLTKKRPYLKRHGWRTFYGEHSCSFRMSELGYYSKVQSQLAVSFNNLEDYLSDLQYAISTPEPKYKNLPGFNSNILQQESEHYSRIRPKQVLKPKETPIKALSERGILYVEARCVDLDPNSPLGVQEEQLQFLHVFLVYCLFKESPLINNDKCLITGNQNEVAIYGRKPGIKLCVEEGKVLPMTDWANNILKEMLQVAKILDSNDKTDTYQKLITRQFEKFKNPDLTPSAQLINKLKTEKSSFLELGLRLAKKHQDFYKKTKLPVTTESQFKQTASKSLEKQKNLEMIEETLLPGYEDLEISTQILIREAQKRHIEVEILDRKENFIKLTKGWRLQYIKQATKTDLDSYVTYLIMADKNVTNQILRSHKLNIPADGVYDSQEKALEDYPKFANKKVVFKPTLTNHGIGISFAGPNDQEGYELGVKEAFKNGPTILIEEFAEGEEFRLLVVDFKCISIVQRIPANVIGDGKHNISELINMKNEDPKYYKFFETYTIKKTATELRNLKSQGLTLKSIPKKGQQIFLRTNSNVGTGGDALEVSDKVHKSYKLLAEQAAKIVKAGICGVDMLIKNPAAPANLKASSTTNPASTKIASSAATQPSPNYAIIELNFNPALQMHHYPVTGKPVNVAAKVLDLLGF